MRPDENRSHFFIDNNKSHFPQSYNRLEYLADHPYQNP